LRAMEGAGRYEEYVGIQTGSERVAADMRRSTRLEVLVEKVKLIRRVTRFGIVAFFMIGYPTEERADVRQTVRLSLALPLDLASFFYFTPHPGTPVFEEACRNASRPVPWDRCHYNQLVDFPRRMSNASIIRWHKYAYLRFYLRPRVLRYLFGRLRDRRQIFRLARRVLGTLFDR